MAEDELEYDFKLAPIDRRNPKSLINLLPKKIAEAVERIPDELWGMPEHDLISRAYGKNVLPEDAKLRHNLWRLYSLEQTKFAGRIKPNEWFRGAATSKHFELNVLPNPERLCLICREPSDSWLNWEYLYRESIPEMLKILRMPIGIDAKSGLPDTRLMDLKLKLFSYLDTRQFGLPTQKIESKSLNVNLTNPKETLDKFKSPEDLDRRLKELEAELARPALPPAIEPALQIGVINVSPDLLVKED